MSDTPEGPKENDDLSNKGIDYLVSALRSAAGFLPIGRVLFSRKTDHPYNP